MYRLALIALTAASICEPGQAVAHDVAAQLKSNADLKYELWSICVEDTSRAYSKSSEEAQVVAIGVMAKCVPSENLYIVAIEAQINNSEPHADLLNVANVLEEYRQDHRKKFLESSVSQVIENRLSHVSR